MANKYLPDADHMVRHVLHQLIRESGQVRGVFPQAFELRDGEEYLSASWLEYFDGTKQEQIKSTVQAIGSARTVKSDHGFAIGNVGEIK
jgi:hypothetical protein